MEMKAIMKTGNFDFKWSGEAFQANMTCKFYYILCQSSLMHE